MKEEFKKSTPEQVAEYLKLHKKGWKPGKIGEKFGKERTTIIYWLKRGGVPTKVYNYEKSVSKIPKEEVGCGHKEKSIKWVLTNWCGLLCYGKRDKIII